MHFNTYKAVLMILTYVLQHFVTWFFKHVHEHERKRFLCHEHDHETNEAAWGRDC